MFQLQLRPVLASTVVVAALALLPVCALGAEARQRGERRERPAATRSIPSSPWSLVDQLIRKLGAMIDPEGLQAKPPQDDESAVRTAPSGLS